jgi:hypothetical protein
MNGNGSIPATIVLGITGHRLSNPVLAANLSAVEDSLAVLFDRVARVAAEAGGSALPRLFSPLADGADQVAARLALARGWQLVAPLPVGRALNAAVNASPHDPDDAAKLAAGKEASHPHVRARAAAIDELSQQAHLVELADRDSCVSQRHRSSLSAADDHRLAQQLDADVSERVALASRIVVEQCDLLVAVWDGVVRNLHGGTGHTVMTALTLGTPVLLIDPAAPADWRMLLGPEDLSHKALAGEPAKAHLDALIAGAVARPTPAVEIGAVRDIAAAFEEADAAATRLSRRYRNGMIANFILAAAASLIGIGYIPLGFEGGKWPFSLIELALLLAILAITALANRRRWHIRWLETRRFAEYLRHAPLMLRLGIMRPAARWPRGKGSRWPELFARDIMRAHGLPAEQVTEGYVRGVLRDHVRPHIRGQRDYHRAKAGRLLHAHHRIERATQVAFALAALLVTAGLLLAGMAWLGFVPVEWAHRAEPWETFLGVALPITGATLSAIGHFTDLERFAGISEVASARLEALDRRAEALLALPEGALTYGDAAVLVRDLDDAVVDEISGWQAVFEGKQITLPA